MRSVLVVVWLGVGRLDTQYGGILSKYVCVIVSVSVSGILGEICINTFSSFCW